MTPSHDPLADALLGLRRRSRAVLSGLDALAPAHGATRPHPLSPSPKLGEGVKEAEYSFPAPPLPIWERGPGGEADRAPTAKENQDGPEPSADVLAVMGLVSLCLRLDGLFEGLPEAPREDDVTPERGPRESLLR